MLFSLSRAFRSAQVSQTRVALGQLVHFDPSTKAPAGRVEKGQKPAWLLALGHLGALKGPGAKEHIK